MADVKIAQLLSATTVNNTDLFIVEDNADTKKITKTNLMNALGINAGGVVSSGSNANGNFIRFDDGTQICWVTLVLGSRINFGAGTYADPYRSPTVQWSFPANFNAPPTVNLTGILTSESAIVRANTMTFSNVSSSTVSGIQSVAVSSNNTYFEVSAHCVAIGRWK